MRDRDLTPHRVSAPPLWSQWSGRGNRSGIRVASPTADCTCPRVRNSAPVRSAPRRSAARRSAPMTSASRRSASRRSAPISSAPRRSAPGRWAPRRSAPARSRRARRHRAGTGHPRPAVRRPDQRAHLRAAGGSTAARSASRSTARRASGSPVASRVTRSATRRRRRAGSRPRGGTGRPHVPEQLVQPAHDREHREHRRAALATAERDLDDVLARAEAVVGHAPGEAPRAQLLVDAAAVVVTEVDARPAGGLVVGEVRRRRERRTDAAQRPAARAVGLQGRERVSHRRGPAWLPRSRARAAPAAGSRRRSPRRRGAPRTRRARR